MASVLEAAAPRRLTFMSTGKAQPPVSADEPVYVVISTGAYHETGWPGVKNDLTRDELDGPVAEMLKKAGYFLADEAHPPTLAITYHWGTHNLPDPNTVDYTVMQKNVLEKAALIGGKRFAKQFAQAINEAAMSNLSVSQGLSGYGNRAAIGAARAVSEIDPVGRFRDRSDKNRFLVEQATSDCYFMIFSAVSVGSTAGEKSELQWQTAATIRADSMTQREAILLVIESASPYLSVAMKEAETLEKKVDKSARR